jgi:hypothetical protein
MELFSVFGEVTQGNNTSFLSVGLLYMQARFGFNFYFRHVIARVYMFHIVELKVILKISSLYGSSFLIDFSHDSQAFDR